MVEQKLFNLLNHDGIKKIHDASLDILENLGVKIYHKEVYRKVIEAGARPDTNETIAYLPRKLVEDSLKKCPGAIKIGNRKGENVELSPNGKSVYWTCNALTWVDEKNRVKDIKNEDFINFIRVIDSLEMVHGMVGTNLCEVPVAARDFVGFRLMLENTYKHLRPCLYTPLGAEIIMEMADVVLDGREYSDLPFFSFGYSIVSPLQWGKEACEIFYKTSGRKIPVMINAEPLAGATSPVTMAGSLALGTAEALSGVVINQVLEPGRPVFFNLGIAHVLDMKTAIALTGAPENGLLAAAGAQIASYFGIPSASWMDTDSLMVDGQAAMEKMLTILTHSMGGANLIWGVGNMESTKSFSPKMAVIDNEIIGAARRLMKGIEVNEETIALELIKQVGFSGDFINTDHTFEHFREEIRDSNLLNRMRREMWDEKGQKSLEDKAQGVVDSILSAENKYYLTGSQTDKIKKIENKWLDKLS